ncbi:molecular chaperone [Raphidocelis subcapitata]|uniref:Molecular chaperone n=1 Tax=Raphidocelis subcapitata TaxID=307507 RepID=A0A2V0NNV0_9CHLO|nr:molecular chaperone [Raphidocelis subcapitata]|eukprot:GBF89281.1 molecular chaperone [Raphidocelis subcapitata]
MLSTRMRARPFARCGAGPQPPAACARPAARHAPRRRRGGAAAAAATFGPATDDAESELSFYELLGVSPNADGRQIKKAYHSLMREVHPDTAAGSGLSLSSGDDAFFFDTTDLAVLLNEIYATLSDPDLRATYDALAGFAAGGANPFKDAGFERDQVFVDEVSCIGCGKCVRSCPGSFVLEDSQYGRARVVTQPRGPVQQEDVQIAMETCPVDCIHWVSAPQLPLLEVALSKMGRVDAFVMMRRGGVATDVFHEAQKAWLRRQAAAAERARVSSYAARAAASAASTPDAGGLWGGVFSRHVDWNPMGAPDPSASGDKDGGAGGGADGGGGGGGGRNAAGRIASLAARAAQSARLWRMAQAAAGPQRVLTE